MSGEVRNYAILNLTTGVVENVALWDGVTEWSPPDGYQAIQSDIAWIGWHYAGGIFSPPEQPEDPGPTDQQLAAAARSQRDSFLRSIYDPGILVAQRALRMAETPEEITYAEGKITDLDIYAEALVAVPGQAGFPQTIIWPIAPTK